MDELQVFGKWMRIPLFGVRSAGTGEATPRVCVINMDEMLTFSPGPDGVTRIKLKGQERGWRIEAAIDFEVFCMAVMKAEGLPEPPMTREQVERREIDTMAYYADVEARRMAED